MCLLNSGLEIGRFVKNSSKKTQTEAKNLKNSSHTNSIIGHITQKIELLEKNLIL